MTRVDCDDCSMNFQTKKLYIKHLKSKECTKSKHMTPQGQPVAKKARLEGQALQESLLKVGLPQQNTAQYSQKQMEVLQSQITQLSQKQKELLQAQITQKQRQVLQAIPYNQLSEKQKEILKRLSSSNAKPASPTTIISAPVQIRPNLVQAPAQPKDSRVEQAIKKGRRKNVYNKIPELKNGQIVRLPNNAIIARAPEPPKLVETEHVIKEFVFSDEPIAADNIEIAGDPITMVAPTEFIATEEELAVGSVVQNPLEMTGGTETILSSSTETAKPSGKAGSIKIKSIANAFQEISNIVAPTATPKETCPHCKKIFSKAGILQHIETKHKIQCDHCEEKFLQEEIEKHIQDVHRAPCTICSEMFVKDTLSQHIDVVHKQECIKCAVKFLKTEIQDHIRNIHEPEGCDDCKARFETKDNLNIHMETIHLTEKCDECTLGFRTVDELDRHSEEAHPKEFCDDCDSVFGTVALLDEHKEKIHPNPNKFVSFNGGMFMMMTIQDENSDEEEKEESDTEDTANLEDENKEIEEAEKAAVYEFLEQLVVETAHDIVKTAMTGKILFSVRFEEEDDSTMENKDDCVEENEDDCVEANEKSDNSENESENEQLEENSEEQLVVETAHDLVKTAMTGQILFSVRFDEEDDSVMENKDNSVKENKEDCVEENEENENEEKEKKENSENEQLEEKREESNDWEELSSTSDNDPLDDVETSDPLDSVMEE
eukprot:GFUD01019866.1.p1 GENE.GFUD01019866.1~~GFUD01019866.1.p1  ORF type:complete len:717 (+),score=230.46 GFUD01019866.1:54-2204(+)